LYGYLTLKPFLAPLIEGEIIYLARAFLNRGKVTISTHSRHVLLIFMVLFTLLIFHFITVFLVLGLNNRVVFFWTYICQVLVHFCVLVYY
jgi:hypothetical protein